MRNFLNAIIIQTCSTLSTATQVTAALFSAILSTTALTASILFYSSLASADIEFIEGLRASGDCPIDSLATTISPDGKAVSILFGESMVLEHQPGISPYKTIKKKCQLKIPLKASPNEKYEIITQDWRGFLALPNNSKLKVTAKTWLTHTINLRNHRQIKLIDYYKVKTSTVEGPMNSDGMLSIESKEPHATLCGQDYDLTLQFDLSLHNDNLATNAMVGVDSLDVAQSPGTQIVKRKCR